MRDVNYNRLIICDNPDLNSLGKKFMTLVLLTRSIKSL